MPKILHVVNISFVLPYFLGDQIDHFKSKGYEISIACSPSDHLLRFGDCKGITVYPINIKRSISLLADLKAVILLSQIIKDNNIDIVVGHTPKGALLAMMAGFVAKVKNRIYFRHGLVFETARGIKRQLLISIERLTSKLAVRIVNVSTSVQQKVIEYGLDFHHKDIILSKGTCNGVDLNRFNKKTTQEIKRVKTKYSLGEGLIVGYVGRLVNDKGINELIDAWRLILDENVNIKLLLVGPYEVRDALPIKTRDFIKNCDSIIEVGHVDNTVELYGIMDMLILPSYREGFPTVVLEASAMSLPIITTRSTGCIDSIIDDFTGIFVDIEASDIKNKILYYYNNPDIAKQHGKNGRRHVAANFTQELIWSEIDKKLYTNYL